MLPDLLPFDDIPLESERVLVRLDLDLPVSAVDGSVVDDARLRASLPTLERVVAGGARLIVAGHRTGNAPDAAPTLEPAAARLAELTGWEIHVPDACTGDAARKVVSDLRSGQVCCLENLLADPGERGRDEAFARELARLADSYVLDSLTLADRDWASLTQLPGLTTHRAVGPGLASDLERLSRVMTRPARPFVAIVGGDSFAAVLPLIDALRRRVDAFCFAGSVGHTLLAATEAQLGATPLDAAELPRARTLLAQLREAGKEVLLPNDLVVVADSRSTEGAPVRVRSVPTEAVAVDLGPDSIETFRARCAEAGTVLWLGDVGLPTSNASGSGDRLLATGLAVTGAFTVLAGETVARAARSAGSAVAARLGLVTEAEAAVRAALLGRRLPALEALT